MTLQQLIVGVLNHHHATGFLHDETCRDVADTIVTVLDVAVHSSGCPEYLGY